MPWKETDPVRERIRFIRACEGGLYTMSELADRFGVSRKTAHKWKARLYEGGLEALEDRSRAPHSCPHRTDEELEQEIVAFRKRFPFMGPAKIIARLEELHPDRAWPAVSTAGDILKREGLVAQRQRRRPPVHPDRPRSEPKGPNDLFTIDYKGQFRLGDRSYCYPLTIVDHFSRYLLACEGLPNNEQAPTKTVFERLFREYGLPRVIRSDNGSPFASPGICRLSRLSVWWIRLGIEIERITPGHPEQNGAHERMHRTLKEQTAMPPARDLASQQKRFDRFRHEYNQERPHQALGQKRPAVLYQPSTRPFPKELLPIEYPGHFETRKADDRGTVKWTDRKLFVSHTFRGEILGFEPIDTGIWSVYFGPVLIARFDERRHRFYT